ncbi:hypothetical protein ACS0TY_031603 [Phlomoides rotata]
MEKSPTMEKKPSTSSSVSSFSLFFKRLNKKGNGAGFRWWKLKSSAGLRWKKRFNLHIWFVDDILFKIVSVFEGIFLVSTVCVFFICCGCHF